MTVIADGTAVPHVRPGPACGSSARSSGASLARAAFLVDEAGGRQWSQAQAEALLAKALRDLSAVNPAPRPAAELTTLARLVTTRTH